MRRFIVLSSIATLSLGLLASAPSHAAEPSGTAVTQSVETAPRVARAAAPPIEGTVGEILQETPVTEPLTVGYKAGLFQPVGALKKKDKRGCTLRNQLLIKAATKKPKIGKNCSLKGGEWWVDFGSKKVTKASKIKINTLMPDKYVYGQGAYGWTPEQRAAYAADIAAPEKSTTKKKAKKTRSAVVLANTVYSSIYNAAQLFTVVNNTFINSSHDALLNEGGLQALSPDVSSSELTPEFAELRERNPDFFNIWSTATVLNVKSWGLSLSPEVSGNFRVTIEQCAAEAPKGEDNNPCVANYSVPNSAAEFNITAVPISASIVPPTITGTNANQGNAQLEAKREALAYQAPTGSVIDRELFGIHAPADWVSDVETGYEGPTDEATIPTVPVGYVRLWDTETTWADIEPKKGEYVWRKLDKQIQTAQALDARVMLVLGQTPSWAGDSPQSMPRDIQDWRNYVREVACRYGPSISSYEVWNEANLKTFFTGTPEQMGDLTKAAFEEIRGCDNSNALVVAANTTSRATGSFATFYPAYLEALKARGWPVDAYSVHSYPTASGGADDRIRGIGQFRTMLALAGAKATTVFDTEINYGLEGLGEGKVASPVRTP